MSLSSCVHVSMCSCVAISKSCNFGRNVMLYFTHSVVLITVSRDWTDFAAIEDMLKSEDEKKVILVHRDAHGADRMAGHVWSKRGGIVEKQPADWKQHGRAAGPIRNESMVNDFPIRQNCYTKRRRSTTRSRHTQ